MKTIPSASTPTAVQTYQWILHPTQYMETNFQRFGDIFDGKVSPVNKEPIIFVNEPKAVQYILSHDNSAEISAPGEVNEVLKPLFGENSLLLLSGAKHRRERKLMMPPFHGERMKAYGSLIQNIAQTVVNSWTVGETFSARDTMQTITMRVILQAVFGLYEGERYQRLEYLLSARLNLASTPLSSAALFFPQLMVDLGPWSMGGKTRRLVEETDALLYAEIRERRANPDPNRTDVLSLLLSARDENGEGLTDIELHDELMTLLVAGHETTATALAWALYWLHRQPEVRQKLLAEFAEVTDSTDYTTIAKLPYLNAVCNETLRIYPVAMLALPRRAEKPLQLLGYDVEAGSLLLGCIYLLHHREDLYPNSKVFRPERFLERQYAPGEFLPFGGGSRRCIGAALAMYELTLVIHTVLTQCELELAERKPVEPQRRGATLAPYGGVRLKKIRNLQKSISSSQIMAETPTS